MVGIDGGWFGDPSAGSSAPLVCLCVCVCVCVWLRVRVRVRVRVRFSIYVCIYAYVHICSNACGRAGVHAGVCEHD